MKNSRPPLLSEKQTSEIVILIQNRQAKKYYLSYEEIRNIIEEDFKHILSYYQVRKYIRNNIKFNLSIGDQIDQVESSEADIDELYNNLTEEVKDVDVCFVYYLDNFGEEEFGDAQEINVIVQKII